MLVRQGTPLDVPLQLAGDPFVDLISRVQIGSFQYMSNISLHATYFGINNRTGRWMGVTYVAYA
jgi:hypothetical protein